MTRILLSCVFLPIPFRHEGCLNTFGHCLVAVDKRVLNHYESQGDVDYVPEMSSTTVIKMLYQVSEYSRKASKSGTETYVKIICLCDETRPEAEAVLEQTIADTVHSSVVRAADCRSTCPWFNSGWRSWFTFMT